MWAEVSPKRADVLSCGCSGSSLAVCREWRRGPDHFRWRHSARRTDRRLEYAECEVRKEDRLLPFSDGTRVEADIQRRGSDRCREPQSSANAGSTNGSLPSSLDVDDGRIDKADMPEIREEDPINLIKPAKPKHRQRHARPIPAAAIMSPPVGTH